MEKKGEHSSTGAKVPGEVRETGRTQRGESEESVRSNHQTSQKLPGQKRRWMNTGRPKRGTQKPEARRGALGRIDCFDCFVT